ncbi:unnamed protein product, partial [Vitis vinifera]|uniref:Uncharacterized protein n=1 Tax=Vitis vinifera TaxID=29760 RepID=D7SNR7_VITVI
MKDEKRKNRECWKCGWSYVLYSEMDSVNHKTEKINCEVQGFQSMKKKKKKKKSSTAETKPRTIHWVDSTC